MKSARPGRTSRAAPGATLLGWPRHSARMPDTRPWLWTAAAPERNAFVIFRRELDLADRPQAAELRLAADARYRLWVNGVILGTGPVRFVPAQPCEDGYDLAPWLVSGANAIVVEVWQPGASTFQTMPEARGGFAPAGAVDAGGTRHDLGAEWRCRVGEAWDGEAPPFSFAQGPVEI